jgi:hypothetical protein
MPVNASSYDRFPSVAVTAPAEAIAIGWAPIAARLHHALAHCPKERVILTIECYPGTDEAGILAQLSRELSPVIALSAADALLPPEKLEGLLAPFLGDDPVFGRLCDWELGQFFNPHKLAALRTHAESASHGLVLIVGCGASLISDGDFLAYADLARWEIQQRQRRNETGNLGADNRTAPAAEKYKRAYFVDWRVCDRWKRALLPRWDFFLDTHRFGEPKLATGETIRQGLATAAHRPFRVVPFFDPAPWGGQWLREKFGLESAPPNFGWGFDCVPEENSLFLDFDGIRLEVPALNVVLAHPHELLGDSVYQRFGAEFPIRFDLLDTMAGGNLSLQVHPLSGYARQTFGLGYTQDESYYILDASKGAHVYLGFREGAKPGDFREALLTAHQGGAPLGVDRFVEAWPARPHDHFLIPAGTIHCSGAHTLVLEISATPYIFTFKLWDWGRLGLDGRPRPTHLAHGLANLQWERTESWTREQLVNQVRSVDSGPGWREERTGLHGLQFIETRRHWFTGQVSHDTGGSVKGGVNVLNLIQGEEAIVESPAGAFAPFVVHYAETFIVPAAVGAYTIRPHGADADRECATIKAFVRPLT